MEASKSYPKMTIIAPRKSVFIDDKDDKELIDLQSLFKRYPGLRNEIKKGPIGRNIHIGTAIQIIWTEADKELRTAIALLSQN
jgi:hypothetical protein